MVSADFKVRYQGSALGYAWSLFRPLFLFGVLYVVFTYIFNLGKGIPHYPVYLLLGIVLWNFMYETTTIGVASIVSNGNLLRKINIPKYLPVLSSSLSALINLALNLVVVFIFMIMSGVYPRPEWLLFPIILIELYFFSLALAFLLSALYVRFRDINYIWELLLQAGFYLTPIIYPLTLATDLQRKLILMNPMAQIIQDARYLLISNSVITPQQVLKPIFVLVPFVFVGVTALVAVKYFKKESAEFAENI